MMGTNWNGAKDYYRKAYMDFNVTDTIAWEQVSKVYLKLYVKDVDVRTPEKNEINLYATTTTSSSISLETKSIEVPYTTPSTLQTNEVKPPQWTEETITWNNAPDLKVENFITTFSIDLSQKDQWILVDVTDFMKMYFTNNPPTNSNNLPIIGLGLQMKNQNDNSKVEFNSKYVDSGKYAPTIVVYEGDYEDTIKPTLKVTGLKQDMIVYEKDLTFQVEAKDMDDSAPKVEVMINEQILSEESDNTYKAQLKPGNNTITIKAKDKAGNQEILTYKIIYKETTRHGITEDAYVRDGSYGDTVYGKQSTIEIKQVTGSGEGYNRRSYLKADLSTNTEPYVRKATLKLYLNKRLTANTAIVDNVSLYEVLGGWSEETLTWKKTQTEMTMGDQVGKTQIKTSQEKSYIDIDITEYINKKLLGKEDVSDLGFALMIDKENANDNSGSQFASVNAASNKPEIVLEKGLPDPLLEITGLEENMKVTVPQIECQVTAKSVNPAIAVTTEILVNNVPIQESKKGSYRLPLVLGDNEIKVRAIDETGNQVEKIFKVTRTEIQQNIIYYVDSEKGNDANNGLSPNTAWKSIDKLNEAYFMPGNKILFKRGGIWNGQGISSKDKNSVFAQGAVHLSDLSYWEINGLEVTNKGETQTKDELRGGIVSLATGAGEIEHIYINDCYVREVNTGCDAWKFTGGILILGDTRDEQGNDTGIRTTYNDVKVENCHVKNVSIEGIRTKTWNNGKDAPDKRNSNVIFRNNLIEDVHGDGLVISEINENGLVEKNIVRRHSLCPTTLNYAGCWI